jgi:hypothetical protein
MTYQKPICDCGEELVLQVNAVVEVEYKINKDGRLSKKRKQNSGLQEQGWGWLYCYKCGNHYDYNYSFRGEEAFKFKREELI